MRVRLGGQARPLRLWVRGYARLDKQDAPGPCPFRPLRCCWPRGLGGRSKRGNGAVRRRNAARFLAYLVDQGAISRPPEEPELDERLTAYCHWLATARALSPSGIEETEIGRAHV